MQAILSRLPVRAFGFPAGSGPGGYRGVIRLSGAVTSLTCAPPLPPPLPPPPRCSPPAGRRKG